MDQEASNRGKEYLVEVVMIYGAVIEVNHHYSSIDRLYAITYEKAYEGIRKCSPTKRSRI